MLYNRASADPDGKPWSERKKYVYWDEAAGEWTGPDVPDFEKNKRPDYVPPEGAKAQDALAGNDPFVMQGDGKAWLFAPAGVVDGPLPTHYEPVESVVENALYTQQANPTVERIEGPWNRENPSLQRGLPVPGDHLPADRAPHRRRDEPHAALPVGAAAGVLRRGEPGAGRAARADQRRVRHAGQRPDGDRGEGAGHRAGAADPAARRAGRAPDRHALPLVLRGISTGDSANDLLGIALDPNTHIQEDKVSTADIVPGRRPRGPGAAGVRRVLPAAGRGGLRAGSGSTAATRSRPTPARDRTCDGHDATKGAA